MTKKECLTNLILSRTYNKKQNCICYGDRDRICKMGFCPIIHYNPNHVIKDTHKIDKEVYNVMYPYCKRCTCCDEDDLPRINIGSRYKISEPNEFGFDENEKIIVLLFRYTD